MQQRPEANVELDLLGLEHVIGLAPVGIRQLYLLKVHVRGPAPVDHNFGDLGLVAGYCVGVVLDLRTHVVRSNERIDTDAQQSDEHEETTERPSQNFEYLPHGYRGAVAA